MGIQLTRAQKWWAAIIVVGAVLFTSGLIKAIVDQPAADTASTLQLSHGAAPFTASPSSVPVISMPANPSPAAAVMASRQALPPTHPAPAPTHLAAPPHLTHAQAPVPAPFSYCGAPSNPDRYTFCGGPMIDSPNPNVCTFFACIDNFWKGEGYMVECRDGMYSMSGGRHGACSYHGGERRPVYLG